MSEVHSIDSLSEEAFRWYLTGLADGEACFGLHELKYRTAQIGYWSARFSIQLRADERPHLEAIARRMNCGRIGADRRCNLTGNRKPSVRWEVYRPHDIAAVIVPHFERFPLQFKKARDFAVWKQAIPLLVELVERPSRGHNRKATAAERGFLATVAAQVKSVRVYVEPAEKS